MTQSGIILVTGGEGFLGTQVVRLLLERKYQVRVFARVKRNTHTAQEGQLSYHLGDIRSREDCAEACQGVKAVIHTASIILRGLRREMDEVNVEGTRLMLEEAEKARVKAFIHTSSISVIHDGSPLSGGIEDGPVVYPDTPYDDYSGSKARAEALVLDWAKKGGNMAVCTLRPGLLYGPGDRSFLPVLIDTFHHCQTRFYWGDHSARMDFTYVENAAHAHVLAVEALTLEPSGLMGKIIHVTDGEPEPFFLFSRELFAAAGHPNHFALRLPLWIILSFARMVTFVYGLLGRQSPLVSKELLYPLCDLYVEMNLARTALGYSPIVPREERVARTAHWLKDQLA
ncbi:hypothetical protein BJ684DRAFT_21633 [Piptocephalis cylindrospora]|uniref:Ketoreductase domain-containing protein n=1 Tax=Piptocephalis cylindrospora TaxID=1907219 RepID=A0A4P9Y033_9FUNG|nr:hypothetical protein BJ684DRAFT_21633 [Piptocephalis cylindrospora]|eukprot:RKP11792.1 hypothetical protein BJ684DRAFT_21633 [Piptocephalis cylindrospora]